MKRWQKITVIMLASVAVVSALGIVALLSILPDPSAYVRARASNSIPVAQPESSRTSVSKTTLPAPSIALKTETPPTAIDEQDPAVERKRLVTDAFMVRYLSDDRIQSRVCDNLHSSPAPFKSAEEFGKQIESSLLGKSQRSAAAEAVMLPVEYALKNEAVRELVRTAQDAAAHGDTGFLKKAQFYTLAAKATASVLGSREELEAISDSAYRLYAISRATALKPEILDDPDLGDLCRGFEQSAVDGITRDQSYDRDRLSRLLQRHGVSNESIGYDPNEETTVRIVQQDGNFQLKLPWLKHVFRQ